MQNRGRTWMGLALVAAGLLWAAPVSAGVGDKAPEFKGTEFINTPEVSMKDLKGQVIFYEIFRTW